MAKQMMGHPMMCSPVWLGLLVFLVGAWFILKDLNLVHIPISIWSIIIVLIGLKMIARSCKCK